MRSFLLMLTFLTRIPVKYPYQYQEEDFIKGIILMPVIGILIGLVLWGISFATYYMDRTLVSILIWLVYIWITGALHIDGLADTVDGIFSNRDKDRILEIMKDSRIGTFGVLAIFFLLSLNIVLSNYTVDYRILIILPVLGRSSALLFCSLSEYVRDEGMGKGIIENTGIKEAIIGMIFLLITGLIINYKLLLPILLIIFSTLYMASYFKKKLGGITGDNIGFVIELTQTIFLFFTYILRGVL